MFCYFLHAIYLAASEKLECSARLPFKRSHPPSAIQRCSVEVHMTLMELGGWVEPLRPFR